MKWFARLFRLSRARPLGISNNQQPATELRFEDLDSETRAQSRAWDVARAFAQTCAAFRNGEPEGAVVDLEAIINTLMTELWDWGFSQSEIRAAFLNAIADMPRYARGMERRE